ncbi:MAG TPA: cation:proton antiporter [Myxococcales bacterium]|nr:cation:proton antiporter [Myxococcales bacterium]
MDHNANQFLINLATVLCVAAVTTVLFQRLRQPVVLGYILAGLVVGPHVPVPLVADREIIEGLSELGVILLLFSIGLEFSFGKLLRVGVSAGIVALVEISVMVILGDLTGRLFGWSAWESLYAGALIAISSTTIIAKAFNELRIGGRVRELVLAVLIVEDLIAILLLAALTTISVAGTFSAPQLGVAAARLALFTAIVVGAGLLVIPRLVRAILRLDRPETTTVACVGICFALALLAQRFGYSVALGAFLAGALVAESGEGARIEHLLEPVRDLFAAVFFVSVGMLIDPALVRANWLPILVLSAVVIAGRIIGVSVPAFLTGAGVRTSIAASMSLAQIGELSFIIAALGISTGMVRDFIYPLAVSVSAVTTLTTPWMIRASGPAAAWVDRKLPHALQTFVALYGSWIDGLRAPGPRRTRAQRLVRLLLLDALLLSGIVIVSARFFSDAVVWLRSAAGLGSRAAEFFVIAAAAALAAPFLVGIVRLVGALAVALAGEVMPAGAPGKVDLAAAPRKALIVALQLAAAVALGLPLFAIARGFLPLLPTLLLFAAAFVFLAIRLWASVTQLQGHVRAGAQVMAAAFSQARGAPARDTTPEQDIGKMLPGLGSPTRFTLSNGSPAVGKTLASLNLRGVTGATVLAIARRGEEVLVPTGQEILMTDDVLALAGTKEAVDAARELLSTGVSAPARRT